MKKSLLALAAMGAFAGAAQAQSSVTVYGLIDYGFGGSASRAAGPNAQSVAQSTTASATTVAGVLRQNTSGFGGSGESTSRIGFRGTEDLGGGTRAFFTAEAALATDNAGAGIFSNNAGNGNRQIFVGLGQKGIGQASIGIQYTPIHEAAAATDAGELNNQNGNVIYDRTGGFGSAQIVAGTGTVGQQSSGMTTNSSYTVRSSNMLMLKTERMSGFMGKLFVVAGGKDEGASLTNQGNSSTTSNLSNNTQGYGGSIDYQWQKLFVTANYQQFTTNVNQNGLSRTYFPGYNGGTMTPGVNSQDNQYYIAATYDFGVLKAFAQYINRKVQNVNNADNYVQRSAQQLGVRAPIGKQVSAWASAGTGAINNTGAGANTAKFNGWQLGTDYNLSKRTNLYAIYGQTATSNAVTNAYAATSNAAATVQPTSYNASSYAVGVRHTF
jgi:predicted porin